MSPLPSLFAIWWRAITFEAFQPPSVKQFGCFSSVFLLLSACSNCFWSPIRFKASQIMKQNLQIALAGFNVKHQMATVQCTKHLTVPDGSVSGWNYGNQLSWWVIIDMMYRHLYRTSELWSHFICLYTEQMCSFVLCHPSPQKYVKGLNTISFECFFKCKCECTWMKNTARCVFSFVEKSKGEFKSHLFATLLLCCVTADFLH